MAIGKPLTGLYGVIAEFPGAQELFDAATAAREAGYTEMDAFSPFPIHGLHKVAGVGFRGIARPSVVGYVDIGYGSDGAAVFTGINYPF